MGKILIVEHKNQQKSPPWGGWAKKELQL